MKKILTEPLTLKALDRIKKRLEGTDRPEHIEEVESYEQKAKDAILKLSAYGHEGIKLLVKQAKEELQIIQTELSKRPEKDLDPVSFTLRQHKLFNMQHLWMWFLGYFGDASQSLKEVNAFIVEQNYPQVEEEY